MLPPAPAPGKLNMAEFSQVSSALSRLNMKPGRAAPPADDEGGDYAVPQDVINNGNHGSEYAQPLLQDQHHERHTRPKPRSKNRERRERAKIGEFYIFLESNLIDIVQNTQTQRQRVHQMRETDLRSREVGGRLVRSAVLFPWPPQLFPVFPPPLQSQNCRSNLSCQQRNVSRISI